MKTYTVAVLGATGAVGQEMIKVLQERNFPVGKLVPLASARSAGKTVKFRGEDVTIQEAADTAFKGVDIVLGAAENDIAKKFAPAIVASGAVFVDNSSAFRLNPEVPLIVPEVNPEDVKNHKGIISNPNCSTIITVTAVNALNTIAPIRTRTASTYQAVSGAGAGGLLFKGIEGHHGLLAGQVGYSPHHHEGHPVGGGSLRDGGALHFHGGGPEAFPDVRLDRLIGDKHVP